MRNVGIFAGACIALFMLTSHAGALDYRLIMLDDGQCGYKRDCPFVLAGTGPIVRDELDRLRAFIKANAKARKPRDFVIQSPGGNLVGGLTLGLMARRLGFRTVAGRVFAGEIKPGLCASACVLVLMGGRQRHVPDGSVVVIHAPAPDVADASARAEAAKDPKVAQGLTKYARDMGVAPAFIALMMSVPNESPRRLTKPEMQRLRLITE